MFGVANGGTSAWALSTVVRCRELRTGGRWLRLGPLHGLGGALAGTYVTLITFVIFIILTPGRSCNSNAIVPAGALTDAFSAGSGVTVHHRRADLTCWCTEWVYSGLVGGMRRHPCPRPHRASSSPRGGWQPFLSWVRPRPSFLTFAFVVYPADHHRHPRHYLLLLHHFAGGWYVADGMPLPLPPSRRASYLSWGGWNCCSGRRLMPEHRYLVSSRVAIECCLQGSWHCTAQLPRHGHLGASFCPRGRRAPPICILHARGRGPGGPWTVSGLACGLCAA